MPGRAAAARCIEQACSTQEALEVVRAELVGARADLAKELERREQAEADALRAGVRSDTLEQVLAQLRPAQAAGSVGKKNPAT